ncbi:histidine kinase [Paenibacillus sp.]|uniref:sensor histidine kinase n=1 Tax=Paenibacillus sp. TaxID=58172 RepID=UPI0028116853|nr:histidine kinase [Paenibacillus sp.]
MPIPKTLKHRLIFLLLLCSLFPVVVIGTMSHSSMYSMLRNEAEKGVAGNLHQTRLSFENTLSQLNHASQQLVFEGEIGRKLDAYLSEADMFEKRRLSEEIESEISLIHFTNPTLGVIFYYLADRNEVIFDNAPLHADFDFFEHPLLAEQLYFTYYGPHVSINPLDGNKVLSVVRKVDIPARDDVYLYMETDFKLTDRILSTDDIFRDTSYFFVDSMDRIAYSEKEADFPTGTSHPPRAAGGSVKKKGYYLFEEASNQSWRIVAAVPEESYNQAIHRWVTKFAVLAALSVTVGCFLAYIIWRMVYKPLLQLQRNIRRLKHGQMSEPLDFTYQKVVEFSEIHRDFASMKQTIDELIVDVDRNAQAKKQLEIENLLYKINPHFIHNTLDTIRWLARVNGHHETDRLVSALNRLLHYNLGKGRTATIREEMEALKNYVMLQGVRYNFTFDVRVNAAKELLELPVPRFILQPLVENSISHGLRNKSGGQGVIEVIVREEAGFSGIVIEVRDNGYGMTEEEAKLLMSGEGEYNSKTGMGIGWHYVRRMLELQFAGEASMQLSSSLGMGTAITLRLPIERKEGRPNVERDGR